MRVLGNILSLFLLGSRSGEIEHVHEQKYNGNCCVHDPTLPAHTIGLEDMPPHAHAAPAGAEGSLEVPPTPPPRTRRSGSRTSLTSESSLGMPPEQLTSCSVNIYIYVCVYLCVHVQLKASGDDGWFN